VKQFVQKCKSFCKNFLFSDGVGLVKHWNWNCIKWNGKTTGKIIGRDRKGHGIATGAELSTTCTFALRCITWKWLTLQCITIG